MKQTHLTTGVNDRVRISQKRGQIDTFSSDLEKAPPRELLKCKLFIYDLGRKILRRIDSFVYNEQRPLVFNGTKSYWAVVLSGVPQGTIIISVLYSLYITDISKDVGFELRLLCNNSV